mmetsp:Transcript_1886/g.3622  ORF Transcript_1886/g.3622 Transcript_1886/m.3622 type:complete len:151 (+) Transcript_1886:153-605(+)
MMLKTHSPIPQLDRERRRSLSRSPNRVESIPVEYDADVEHYNIGDDDETPPHTKQVISYLFANMPIPGKFLVEKAQALNVPKGCMYGVLKGGKSATFTDPTTRWKPSRRARPCRPTVPLSRMCTEAYVDRSSMMGYFPCRHAPSPAAAAR